MRSSALVGALSAALLFVLPWGAAAGAAAAAAAPGGGGPGPGPGADPTWRWTAAGTCPYYCRCYLAGGAGLRTADCAGRRLLSAEDLRLPWDTDVADLSDNAVSTLQDGSFRAQGLARLAELRLARNGIREVGAWAFAGLRRLHLLDLSHNHLQVLHPGTFDDNRALKVLLLAGNNLARLPADRPLLAAPRLQVLDLSDCRLAYLGSTVLSELPALASLNLSANYLIQVQPQALSRQRQLQVLDLCRNPLACDLNTHQMLQALASPPRNATVRTSCPTASGAPQRQLSKHLSRLQADVLPRPRHAAEAGAGQESLERVEIEALGVDPGLGPGPARPSPSSGLGLGSVRRTHERMSDLSNLDEQGVHETVERFEVDYEDDDPVADDLPEEPRAETGTVVTVRRTDPTGSGCNPLFPDRTSKNPPYVREWFDQIPSFWAALFGCQVGLVLGLVIASCACRSSSSSRAFASCCPPSSGGVAAACGRASGRASGCASARTRAGLRGRRGRDRSRLSPEMAYGGLSLDSWEDDLVAIACTSCDDGGSTAARTPSTSNGHARPETPPPAYCDLVHLCATRSTSPGHRAATHSGVVRPEV